MDSVTEINQSKVVKCKKRVLLGKGSYSRYFAPLGKFGMLSVARRGHPVDFARKMQHMLYLLRIGIVEQISMRFISFLSHYTLHPITQLTVYLWRIFHIRCHVNSPVTGTDKYLESRIRCRM